MSFKQVPKLIWVEHGHGEGSPQVIRGRLRRTIAAAEYIGYPAGLASGGLFDPTATTNLVGRIVSPTLKEDGTLVDEVDVEIFPPASVLAARVSVAGNNPFPHQYAKLTWIPATPEVQLTPQDPPFAAGDIVVFAIGQIGPAPDSSTADVLFIPVRNWGLLVPNISV